MLLAIHNLHVSTPEGIEIIHGLDLQLEEGRVHALMGPNGSGKSTLAQAIMGNPSYAVKEGEILFDGRNILDLPIDERARLGIFLAFQYPQSIPGVPLRSFLKSALRSLRGERVNMAEFNKTLDGALAELKADRSFLERAVNDGLSGGEKKKSEILQLKVLKPRFAILDETDSGLDVDALKIVAEGIESARRESPGMTVLIITHYQRILKYLKPDSVHILVKGKIVKSGGAGLAEELERSGYQKFLISH